MIVDADTSTGALARLIGVRIRIDADGQDVRYGVFSTLWHSQRGRSLGGMIVEEPHGTCRGGDTATDIPYGSTISVVPTSTPELRSRKFRDRDMRNRIWTAAHGLHFDDMPARLVPGAALVAISEKWRHSVEVPMGWHPDFAELLGGMVTLNVYPHGEVMHPLAGTRYDTRRDADRAAYQAGLTGFLVYEDQAHRFPALRG